MHRKCIEELQRLHSISRSELQELWQELFGKPPHPKLRRQLLVPILAYRIQEKAQGGLKASTRAYLNQLSLQPNGKDKARQQQRIKPGTRLLRQWHGKNHEVAVTEQSYRYGNREYKTLSEIACLITGTRWSGPLFFGLRERSRPEGVR